MKMRNRKVRLEQRQQKYENEKGRYPNNGLGFHRPGSLKK